MVLFRAVLQAKNGKAVKELVTMLKGAASVIPPYQAEVLQMRILTDISGPHNTVVIETTHENLAAVEAYRNAMFARTDVPEEADRAGDLVVSGYNEYYTIEA